MNTSPNKRLRMDSPARTVESQPSEAAKPEPLSLPNSTASSTPNTSKPRHARSMRNGDSNGIGTRESNRTGDASLTLPASSSPYMPMFQTFRAELDAHHDRRERVIKTSRDVTATSKKMIFTLQRTPSLASPLPQNIQSDLSGKETFISSLLKSIYPSDLSGINLWRYQRQVSPGMQELMEAAVFRHYLATGKLLSFETAEAEISRLLSSSNAKSRNGTDPDTETDDSKAVDTTTNSSSSSSTTTSTCPLLTHEDYLLGIFDAVGEMMRWGITNLALTRGSSSAATNLTTTEFPPPPPSQRPSLIQDLQTLRSSLETLKTAHSGIDWEAGKKMEVMRTCVEKVENAVYGMVVRGSERPVGWVPVPSVNTFAGGAAGAGTGTGGEDEREDRR